MTANQIADASSALTTTVNGVVDTFISMLPIIGLTVGAIFAIKFIKRRFTKVENIK